jgi:hypothetical protein
MLNMSKYQEGEPRAGQGLFKDPKKIQPFCTSGVTKLTPESGQVRPVAPTDQPQHATSPSFEFNH